MVLRSEEGDAQELQGLRQRCSDSTDEPGVDGQLLSG